MMSQKQRHNAFFTVYLLLPIFQSCIHFRKVSVLFHYFFFAPKQLNFLILDHTGKTNATSTVVCLFLAYVFSSREIFNKLKLSERTI